jgi:hypothetical protein
VAHAAALCTVLSLAWPGVRAQTVTITEGEATIISGGAGYLAAAGLRLRACDALMTGPNGLVQVEFSDGGKIVLGPASRLVFDVPHAGTPVVGPHFLVSGWVKLTVPQRDKAVPHRIHAPQFDVLADDGVAVLRIAEEQGDLFVEQGRVAALIGEGAASRIDVGAGRTFTRKGRQGRGAVEDRLPPDFSKSVPASFRDTLPSLLTQVQKRNVQPKPAPDYRPDEAAAWLRGVPGLAVCFADVTVLSAQRALDRGGFDVGPIDGVLGPRTQAALRAFQQSKGLPASGRLDEDTLKALEVEEQR